MYMLVHMHVSSMAHWCVLHSFRTIMELYVSMAMMIMERCPYAYVLTLCVITPLWFVLNTFLVISLFLLGLCLLATYFPVQSVCMYSRLRPCGWWTVDSLFRLLCLLVIFCLSSSTRTQSGPIYTRSGWFVQSPKAGLPCVRLSIGFSLSFFCVSPCLKCQRVSLSYL